MASKDDKRRDKIQSPAPNQAFLNNYDAVFGRVCDECGKHGCEDCATENKEEKV